MLWQMALEDIRDFNRRNPTSQISRETIERSLSGAERTTEKMRNGITLSTRNQAILERMLRDFGPPTAYE